MTNQLSMFDNEPVNTTEQDAPAVITILSFNDNRRTFTKIEQKRWARCYKVIWTPKPKYAASGNQAWFTVYLNNPTDTVHMGGMTMNELAEEIIIVGQIPEAT